MHKNNDESYRCRVCGLKRLSQPWGEDGQTPVFEICKCCGVEFGYEDCDVQSVKKFREEWLNDGAKWFRLKAKPENWSLEEQLKQIPKAFQ
jgi:hypothetical protein